MARTVRVNASLDETLLARIDAFAARRQEDRSTAIRQLVDLALRELAKSDALTAYRQGRVTLREFARLLALDVWQAQDLLAAEGVPVGQGGREDTAAALQELLTATRRPGSR